MHQIEIDVGGISVPVQLNAANSSAAFELPLNNDGRRLKEKLQHVLNKTVTREPSHCNTEDYGHASRKWNYLSGLTAFARDYSNRRAKVLQRKLQQLNYVGPIMMCGCDLTTERYKAEREAAYLKMSQEMAQLKVKLMEKECENLDLRLEKVSLVTKIDNITFLNEDLFQITLKQNDRYVSVVEKKRTIEDENAELRQDAGRLNEQIQALELELNEDNLSRMDEELQAYKLENRNIILDKDQVIKKCMHLEEKQKELLQAYKSIALIHIQETSVHDLRFWKAAHFCLLYGIGLGHVIMFTLHAFKTVLSR